MSRSDRPIRPTSSNLQLQEVGRRKAAPGLGFAQSVQPSNLFAVRHTHRRERECGGVHARSRLRRNLRTEVGRLDVSHWKTSEASMSDEKRAKGSMRDQMPNAAEAVDWLRLALGAGYVDAKIAQAERARRHFERLKSTQGRDAAEAWRRANWRECAFHVSERGHTVGLADPTTDPESAIEPSIDERIVDAYRTGGPSEANRVAWEIGSFGRDHSLDDWAEVQTSAQRPIFKAKGARR